MKRILYEGEWEWQFFAIHEWESGQALSRWMPNHKNKEYWDGNIEDSNSFEHSAQFQSIKDANEVRSILVKSFVKQYPTDNAAFAIFEIYLKRTTYIETAAKDVEDPSYPRATI